MSARSSVTAAGAGETLWEVRCSAILFSSCTCTIGTPVRFMVKAGGGAIRLPRHLVFVSIGLQGNGRANARPPDFAAMPRGEWSSGVETYAFLA